MFAAFALSLLVQSQDMSRKSFIYHSDKLYIKDLDFTAISRIFHIEPIFNRRWAKTEVPGEKPPDLPLQNLASHVYPSSGERSRISHHCSGTCEMFVCQKNHCFQEQREMLNSQRRS